MPLTTAHSESLAAYTRGPAGPRHPTFLLGEGILVIVLVALSLVVKKHGGPLPGDVGLELDVQKALLPHPVIRNPVEAISTLNWPRPTIVTLAVIAAIFLVLRRWLDAIVVPVAAAISSGATYELSRWVHRSRPSGHGIQVLQVLTGTYSFPSGHVTYAMTIFGLFFFLSCQVRRPIHSAFIWTVRVLLVLLIVLMPVSRALEGEHWPTDVLAGLINGLFWLVLFAHVYLWARKRWPFLLAADEV